MESRIKTTRAAVKGNFEFYRTKAVLCFLLTSIVFGAFFVLYTQIKANDKIIYGEAEILNNWRFAEEKSFSALSENYNEMSNINSLSEIKISDSNNYIRLETTIEPYDYARYVYLNTYYNQIYVEINKDEVVDTINENKVFGENFRQIIKIEPSDTETTIGIILKISLLPKLIAYISDTEQSVMPISMLDAIIALLVLLTTIFSIILVAIGIVTVNLRLKQCLVIVGFSSILYCIFLLFFGLFLYMDYNSFILMRISFALTMVSSIVLGYAAIKIAELKNGFLFVLISAGVLYITVYVTTDRDPIIYFLTKCFPIYTTLFFASILLTLLRRLPRERIGWMHFISLSFVFLCYTVYWSAFMWRSSNFAVPILLFAFLQYCIVAICQLVFSKLHKHWLNKDEVIDDSWLMAYKPDNLGNIQKLFDVFSQSTVSLTHVRNVSLYVYEICFQSGMPEEQAQMVAKASFLHDIGKVMVPLKTVTKVGTLSPEEYEQMKMHVQYGYEILSSDKDEFMSAAAVIAKQHHERFDGNGYFGMKGDDIHIYAQITCIADVFEALTTAREYKKPWNFEDSFKYIVDHGGIYFAPKYVDAFKKCRNEIYKIYINTQGK